MQRAGEVDMRKVVGSLTVRIKVVGQTRVMARFWLAMKVLTLAAWLMPTKVEIHAEGP
jgi:hypothetical protein